MVAALRSVGSTVVLAVGIMYLFAIVLTQWAKSYGPEDLCVLELPASECDAPTCFQEFFGTILKSFLSLMQILVFDDTFDIVRPAFRERADIGVLLILYMLLMSFTILNMLIGVICGIVSQSCSMEREKMLRGKVKDIFANMDTDVSGFISRAEFEEQQGPDQLRKVGIDGSFVTDAFDILDDNGDGVLHSDEFTCMIFKCINPLQTQEVLAIGPRIDAVTRSAGIDVQATAVLETERKRYARTFPLIDSGQSVERPPASDRLNELGEELQKLSCAVQALCAQRAGIGFKSVGRCTSTPKDIHTSRNREQALAQLGQALRIHHAQLHALRAETKAAGLRLLGGMNLVLGHGSPLGALINDAVRETEAVTEYLTQELT